MPKQYNVIQGNDNNKKFYKNYMKQPLKTN